MAYKVVFIKTHTHVFGNSLEEEKYFNLNYIINDIIFDIFIYRKYFI